MSEFLEENKIPTGFLITLLVQFAQIIIDRAIYLRKYIKGKLMFQIFVVIFIHMWLFFVLPAITDKYAHLTLTSPLKFGCFQSVHSFIESSTKAVVHLQVYLLFAVCLPNQKWLPNPNFGKHLLQKVQFCQLVSFQNVS